MALLGTLQDPVNVHPRTCPSPRSLRDLHISAIRSPTAGTPSCPENFFLKGLPPEESQSGTNSSSTVSRESPGPVTETRLEIVSQAVPL